MLLAGSDLGASDTVPVHVCNPEIAKYLNSYIAVYGIVSRGYLL